MSRGRGSLRRAALAALAVEVVLTAVLTYAIFPSLWAVRIAVFDIDQSAGADRGINLTEVANHPEAMWGRTVTISAEVDRRFGDRALVLGNDRPFVGDKVLIVAPVDFAALTVPTATDAIDDGDVLRVTGVVRPFDPPALAADLRFQPGDPLFAAYEGKSVLVAERLEPDPPAALGPGDKEFPHSSDGYDIGITAYDLTERPDDYLGMVVTVSGEIEEGLLTPHAFLLDDDALLIVSAEPQPEVFNEATAYVTGVVRRFDLATIEAELGLDLDDGRFAPYQGDPVVVARIVEVVA